MSRSFFLVDILWKVPVGDTDRIMVVQGLLQFCWDGEIQKKVLFVILWRWSRGSVITRLWSYICVRRKRKWWSLILQVEKHMSNTNKHQSPKNRTRRLVECPFHKIFKYFRLKQTVALQFRPVALPVCSSHQPQAPSVCRSLRVVKVSRILRQRGKHLWLPREAPKPSSAHCFFVSCFCWCLFG